jgi:hypothetical protein
MSNPLHADTVLRYIKSVAARNNVTIKWEDKPAPRTDGTTVYLPRIGTGMSEKQLNNLRLFVKHETCHVKLSDFSVLHKYQPEGLLMFIANLLEDHRIDYLNDVAYAGDRLLTQAFMCEFYGKAESKQPYTTLFAWDRDVRCDIYVLDEMKAEVDDVLKNKLSAYSDSLREVRLIEDAAAGTLATYKLAKRIFDEVFESKGGAEKGGEDGESEGEDAEGSEASDKRGEEKGKGKTKAASSKGDGGDEDAGRGEASACEYTPMYAPHTPDDKRSGVTGVARCSGEGYTPYERTLLITPRNPSPWAENVRREASYILGCAEGSNMHNILRQRLQIISKARTVYGQKRGKLHTSSLFKVGVDSPGKDRIFTKKMNSESLDVAVSILIDCSGSMKGSNRIEHACAAALMLKDVFSTLRIPLEVLGFTDDMRNHIVYEMQKFGEDVPKNNMAEFMSRFTLMDNVDGESILYAYNRLRMRREKRLILIVLSDGSPCGGACNGNIDHYTKEVIDAIEREGKVELLGVGIEHEGVKYWYKKWENISEASEIESKLIQLVDKRVFRS